MTTGRLKGALLAQLLGQALTGWTAVLHLARWPDVSIWVLASLIVAAVVPFRHDGSPRNRAVGNFGASLLISGFVVWDVLLGGLDAILGGSGSAGVAEIMLTLTGAVLFTLAGALFWLMQRDDER